MRFFFRRKPVNPLTQAEQLLEAAMLIIWQHKKTGSFHPTQQDFETLEQIELRLWQANAELGYIIRCLRQLAAGEKEGCPKYTTPETFDYHFPK